MDSGIVKLLRLAGDILVFCIGVYVLVIEARAFTTAIDAAREKIKKDVLYQQDVTVDRETVTYAELVATLMQPLEYDIMIDDVQINKEDHDKYKINGYDIKIGDYAKSYCYDDNGNIKMIIYIPKS